MTVNNNSKGNGRSSSSNLRCLDFDHKGSTPLLLIAILLIIGLFIWWLNIPFIEDIFTAGTITLIMVMGFQVYMGNSGILNWSYVGYVGIGAFASAIFSMTPNVKSMQIPGMYQALINLNMPYGVALIMGALVAMIIAAIIAWPLMRLSDAAGAITQFSLLIVINVILAQWVQVTNGPRTFTLGGSRQTTFWVAIGVAVIAIIAAFIFKESSLGLKLRASRDDKYAARSSGVNFVAVRYLGYVTSAFMGGLAGGLYSHYILSITASSFYMSLLFTLLSMLVVGGSMSVSGAFFGTVILTLVKQGLRQVEPLLTRSGIEASGSAEIIVAVLMIVFLIWQPDGIMGRKELSLYSIKQAFSINKTPKAE